MHKQEKNKNIPIAQNNELLSLMVRPGSNRDHQVLGSIPVIDFNYFKFTSEKTIIFLWQGFMCILMG